MNITEKRQSKRYMREFVPAMLGYVIVLAVVVMLVDQDSASPWNVVWMLTPIIPAVFGVKAVYGWISRADEYQQRIQLESMAVGFAVAMLTALTMGFLLVDVSLRFGGYLVFTLGMSTWAVTAAAKSRES